MAPQKTMASSTKSGIPPPASSAAVALVLSASRLDDIDEPKHDHDGQRNSEKPKQYRHSDPHPEHVDLEFEEQI
jgi:hypothetical protein